MAETPDKTFDEVVAEAGSTLASKYAEAVAAQEAAKVAATPEVTTPPAPDSSPAGDAAAGEGSAPKTEAQPKDDGFDPEKTLSRYKTQEEKDAALVEKDRELLKRSKQNEERDAEIARLKAENESLRSGKPAAAAPATTEAPTKAEKPEPKDFRPWLEEVVTVERPDVLPAHLRPVHADFQKLRAGKSDLDQTGAKIAELRTKESTLEGEIRSLDLEISTLDRGYKADPDSMALRDMLEAARATRAAKDIEYTRAQISRSTLLSELSVKSAEFKEAKDRYEAAAIRLHSDIQSHEARATEANEEDAKLRNSWASMIKTKVLDRTDLDADSKATIVESLEARLNRIEGDLPRDFGAWADGHKDVFDRELRKSANGAAAIAAREGGNAPRTPSNGTVSPSSSTRKETRKESIDTVFNDASKKFESFFERAR